MAHHSSRNILWHRAIAVLLAVSALTIEPVLAGDGATMPNWRR